MNLTVICYDCGRPEDHYYGYEYLPSDMEYARFDNIEDAAQYMFEQDTKDSDTDYIHNVIDNDLPIDNNDHSLDDSECIFNKGLTAEVFKIYRDKLKAYKKRLKEERLLAAKEAKKKKEKSKAQAIRNNIAKEKRQLARLKEKYE